MGLIVANCGHELASIKKENSITIRRTTSEGKRAIQTLIACTKCKKEYRNSGLLLDNHKEINRWLNIESKNYNQNYHLLEQI